MMRWTAAAASTITALLVAPTAALAERWTPENSFRDQTVTAAIEYADDPVPASGPQRRYHYERTYIDAPGPCPDERREFVYRVWDDGSGRRELVYAGCPRGRPDPRPQPPSAAQVRDAVGIPDPTIATSPRDATLAGMRTDFWYTGPTERTVTVTLNGFTVTATARATTFLWQFGDGTQTTTTTAGSEQSPATSHAYRDRGTKTVTLTVTWTGTFTFTAPDGTTGSGDLGAQSFSSSRPLPVREVQPVGRP